MIERQALSQRVESYRFWDVVSLWARERLEHEDIVASALAAAVIRDGLRLQAVDARWLDGKPEVDFRGYPYVGYRARPDSAMSILRATTLAHLLAIVEKAERPQRQSLGEEFIQREDFRQWAEAQGIRLPDFWFGNAA